MIIETWILVIMFSFIAISSLVSTMGWICKDNENKKMLKQIKDLEMVCEFQSNTISKLRSKIAFLKLNMEEKKK